MDSFIYLVLYHYLFIYYQMHAQPSPHVKKKKKNSWVSHNSLQGEQIFSCHRKTHPRLWSAREPGSRRNSVCPLTWHGLSWQWMEIGPRRFRICQLLHYHRSNEQQSLCWHHEYFISLCGQMEKWQPCKASPSFYEHFLMCWSLNTSQMAPL